MVPAKMNIIVDRILNRVIEFTERAEINPTPNNLSIARMWINQMNESINKDKYHGIINKILYVDDSVIDKKNVTSNIDLYIKPQNTLIMSLSTNFISFDNFSGVEDMENTNNLNILVSSSLPYQINAYLPVEIQNSNMSNTLDKQILNIKESNELIYQNFINTTDNITLKDNCSPGNNIKHGIDIKLKGGISHEKDIYKTTVKLEIRQK